VTHGDSPENAPLADSRKGKPTRHRHRPNRFTFETSTCGDRPFPHWQQIHRSRPGLHSNRRVLSRLPRSSRPRARHHLSGLLGAVPAMRQIKTRQLVRRCPKCRQIHTGPVAITAPVPRKAAKQKAPGRKARPPGRRSAMQEVEPPAKITLLESRPVDVLPGETRRRPRCRLWRRHWTAQPSRRWISASGATPWACSIRTERSTHRLVFEIRGLFPFIQGRYLWRLPAVCRGFESPDKSHHEGE
jgi:hypothetical protein